MPSLNEVVAAIYGALRLALFDARGLGCFTSTVDGFWRSFFAAIIVAPLFAISLLLPGDEVGVPRTAAFGLVEAIAYVVSWLAYPVVVELVSRPLGCRARFLGYMTAYNWSTIIQHTIIASMVILAALDVLPLQVGRFLWLLATIYLLAYVWFIARSALLVPPLTAGVLVAIDLLLSFLITRTAASIEATLAQLPAVQ